ILSRILWLDGLEAHNQNTKARYIYIHGTTDNQPMGAALSHGCIRMRNQDIIKLFELVKIDEQVVIK
ncbi:MAG: L,D-transpeptidase, partial [Candidatus Thioglobus sp.]